jgi:hypothetical protein
VRAEVAAENPGCDSELHSVCHSSTPAYTLTAARRPEQCPNRGDEAKREFEAMMDMKKIDVAAIEAARRARRS